MGDGWGWGGVGWGWGRGAGRVDDNVYEGVGQEGGYNRKGGRVWDGII